MKTFSQFHNATIYSEKHPNETIELYILDSNDNLACHYFMRDTKIHKSLTVYLPNGTIKKQCGFNDGLKHGEYKNCYTDGNVHYWCFYENGIKHGEIKEYEPNGSIHQHKFYIDGVIQQQLD